MKEYRCSYDMNEQVERPFSYSATKGLTVGSFHYTRSFLNDMSVFTDLYKVVKRSEISTLDEPHTMTKKAKGSEISPSPLLFNEEKNVENLKKMVKLTGDIVEFAINNIYITLYNAKELDFRCRDKTTLLHKYKRYKLDVFHCLEAFDAKLPSKIDTGSILLLDMQGDIYSQEPILLSPSSAIVENTDIFRKTLSKSYDISQAEYRYIFDTQSEVYNLNSYTKILSSLKDAYYQRSDILTSSNKTIYRDDYFSPVYQQEHSIGSSDGLTSLAINKYVQQDDVLSIYRRPKHFNESPLLGIELEGKAYPRPTHVFDEYFLEERKCIEYSKRHNSLNSEQDVAWQTINYQLYRGIDYNSFESGFTGLSESRTCFGNIKVNNYLETMNVANKNITESSVFSLRDGGQGIQSNHGFSALHDHGGEMSTNTDFLSLGEFGKDVPHNSYFTNLSQGTSDTHVFDTSKGEVYKSGGSNPIHIDDDAFLYMSTDFNTQEDAFFGMKSGGKDQGYFGEIHLPLFSFGGNIDLGQDYSRHLYTDADVAKRRDTDDYLLKIRSGYGVDLPGTSFLTQASSNLTTPQQLSTLGFSGGVVHTDDGLYSFSDNLSYVHMNREDCSLKDRGMVTHKFDDLAQVVKSNLTNPIHNLTANSYILDESIKYTTVFEGSEGWEKSSSGNPTAFFDKGIAFRQGSGKKCYSEDPLRISKIGYSNNFTFLHDLYVAIDGKSEISAKLTDTFKRFKDAGAIISTSDVYGFIGELESKIDVIEFTKELVENYNEIESPTDLIPILARRRDMLLRALGIPLKKAHFDLHDLLSEVISSFDVNNDLAKTDELIIIADILKDIKEDMMSGSLTKETLDFVRNEVVFVDANKLNTSTNESLKELSKSRGDTSTLESDNISLYHEEKDLTQNRFGTTLRKEDYDVSKLDNLKELVASILDLAEFELTLNDGLSACTDFWTNKDTLHWLSTTADLDTTEYLAVLDGLDGDITTHAKGTGLSNIKATGIIDGLEKWLDFYRDMSKDSQQIDLTKSKDTSTNTSGEFLGNQGRVVASEFDYNKPNWFAPTKNIDIESAEIWFDYARELAKNSIEVSVNNTVKNLNDIVDDVIAVTNISGNIDTAYNELTLTMRDKVISEIKNNTKWLSDTFDIMKNTDIINLALELRDLGESEQIRTVTNENNIDTSNIEDQWVTRESEFTRNGLSSDNTLSVESNLDGNRLNGFTAWLGDCKDVFEAKESLSLEKLGGLLANIGVSDDWLSNIIDFFTTEREELEKWLSRVVNVFKDGNSKHLSTGRTLVETLDYLKSIDGGISEINHIDNPKRLGSGANDISSDHQDVWVAGDFSDIEWLQTEEYMTTVQSDMSAANQPLWFEKRKNVYTEKEISNWFSKPSSIVYENDSADFILRVDGDTSTINDQLCLEKLKDMQMNAGGVSVSKSISEIFNQPLDKWLVSSKTLRIHEPNLQVYGGASSRDIGISNILNTLTYSKTLYDEDSSTLLKDCFKGVQSFEHTSLEKGCDEIYSKGYLRGLDIQANSYQVETPLFLQSTSTDLDIAESMIALKPDYGHTSVFNELVKLDTESSIGVFDDSNKWLDAHKCFDVDHGGVFISPDKKDASSAYTDNWLSRRVDVNSEETLLNVTKQSGGIFASSEDFWLNTGANLEFTNSLTTLDKALGDISKGDVISLFGSPKGTNIDNIPDTWFTNSLDMYSRDDAKHLSSSNDLGESNLLNPLTRSYGDLNTWHPVKGLDTNKEMYQQDTIKSLETVRNFWNKCTLNTLSRSSDLSNFNPGSFLGSSRDLGEHCTENWFSTIRSISSPLGNHWLDRSGDLRKDKGTTGIVKRNAGLANSFMNNWVNNTKDLNYQNTDLTLDTQTNFVTVCDIQSIEKVSSDIFGGGTFIGIDLDRGSISNSGSDDYWLIGEKDILSKTDSSFISKNRKELGESSNITSLNAVFDLGYGEDATLLEKASQSSYIQEGNLWLSTASDIAQTIDLLPLRKIDTSTSLLSKNTWVSRVTEFNDNDSIVNLEKTSTGMIWDSGHSKLSSSRDIYTSNSLDHWITRNTDISEEHQDYWLDSLRDVNLDSSQVSLNTRRKEINLSDCIFLGKRELGLIYDHSDNWLSSSRCFTMTEELMEFSVNRSVSYSDNLTPLLKTGQSIGEPGEGIKHLSKTKDTLAENQSLWLDGNTDINYSSCNLWLSRESTIEKFNPGQWLDTFTDVEIDNSLKALDTLTTMSTSPDITALTVDQISVMVDKTKTWLNKYKDLSEKNTTLSLDKSTKTTARADLDNPAKQLSSEKDVVCAEDLKTFTKATKLLDVMDRLEALSDSKDLNLYPDVVALVKGFSDFVKDQEFVELRKALRDFRIEEEQELAITRIVNFRIEMDQGSWLERTQNMKQDDFFEGLFRPLGGLKSKDTTAHLSKLYDVGVVDFTTKWLSKLYDVAFDDGGEFLHRPNYSVAEDLKERFIDTFKDLQESREFDGLLKDIHDTMFAEALEQLSKLGSKVTQSDTQKWFIKTFKDSGVLDSFARFADKAYRSIMTPDDSGWTSEKDAKDVSMANKLEFMYSFTESGIIDDVSAWLDHFSVFGANRIKDIGVEKVAKSSGVAIEIGEMLERYVRDINVEDTLLSLTDTFHDLVYEPLENWLINFRDISVDKESKMIDAVTRMIEEGGHEKSLELIKNIYKIPYLDMLINDSVAREIIMFEQPKGYEADDGFLMDLGRGVDELLLPQLDYPYEDIKESIFDYEKGEPINPVEQIDDTTFIAKLPTNHPFNFGKEIGREYLDVDVGVMKHMIDVFYTTWQNNVFRLGTMDFKQAVERMLHYMEMYIHYRAPYNKEEDARRCYQMFRWYAEAIILKHGEYRVTFEYKPWKSELYEGSISCPHSLNNVIINSGYVLEATSNIASVELEQDIKKDGYITFDLRILGDADIYVNSEKVNSVDRGGRIEIPIEKGSLNFRIEFAGEMFKMGNITIDNCEFDDITTEYHYSPGKGVTGLHMLTTGVCSYFAVTQDNFELLEEGIQGAVALSDLSNSLIEYYNNHHRQKEKGRRRTVKKGML